MWFLEENIEEKVHNICLSNDFLVMTPKEQATKAKIDKWDYIKLKSFCTTKEMISRVKSILWNEGKNLQSILCDKRLLSNIYEELPVITSKKTNNLILKWAKNLNRHFSKEDIQMVNRYMKRCSTSGKGISNHNKILPHTC